MTAATVERPQTAPRRPSVLGMLARQIVYQLNMLVRSPIGSFATLVIPLMVLLAVNLLFNGTRLPSRGDIRFAQFFTPAMIAFAVVNSCYMSVISSVTLARDEGILKRIRSTPLPSWIYMAGRVISAGILATASAIVVIAVGASVYGFQMVWSGLPAALVTLIAAMFCFCSLGLAVTVLIPKADSALPVAWGTILPFCFISDVFQPIDNAPHWLRTAASVFPLRPFADDLESAFNPVAGGHALHPGHLLVVTAWGTAGLIFALVAFRWEPESHRSGHASGRAPSRSFAPDRLVGLLLARGGDTPPPQPTTARNDPEKRPQGAPHGERSAPGATGPSTESEGSPSAEDSSLPPRR